jgi:hypothetical protein
MSNTRPWILGAAALSVLLAVAGWFLLISPERGKAADLHDQRVAEVQKNDKLTLEVAQLKAQFKTLPAKQAELAVIRRQLPNNPGLPTLIRSLTTIANESGAGLTSVAPSAPVAVVAGATPGTVAPATAGTATPAAAAPVGLVAVPLVIVVDGSYAENELFLQKLQTAVTRAFLVQSLKINVLQEASLSNDTPFKPEGNLLRTTITGSVFVLQDTPATTAAAAAVTGAVAAPSTTTPTS